MNDDPFTQLGMAAAETHELFQSFMAVGFTEHQALYLVGQIIQAGIANNPEASS